jgi:hypothetical protein
VAFVWSEFCISLLQYAVHSSQFIVYSLLSNPLSSYTNDQEVIIYPATWCHSTRYLNINFHHSEGLHVIKVTSKKGNTTHNSLTRNALYEDGQLTQLPVLAKGIITHNKAILNKNYFKCILLSLSFISAWRWPTWADICRFNKHHKLRCVDSFNLHI